MFSILACTLCESPLSTDGEAHEVFLIW